MEQEHENYVTTTRPVIPPYSQHPTLVTANPHVILRPFQVGDLGALHELRTQIEVMKWTSTGKIDADVAKTREWMNRFMEVEEILQKSTEEEALKQIPTASKSSTRFNFAIVYRERLPEPGNTSALYEQVIGAGGCHVTEPQPECGYMIRKEYWGKGITTAFLTTFLNAYWKLDRATVKIPAASTTKPSQHPEAYRGTKDDLEQGAPVVREILKAEIEATNIASQRVLEKCGFQYQKTETIEENGTQVTLAQFILTRP